MGQFSGGAFIQGQFPRETYWGEKNSPGRNSKGAISLESSLLQENPVTQKILFLKKLSEFYKEETLKFCQKYIHMTLNRWY